MHRFTCLLLISIVVCMQAGHAADRSIKPLSAELLLDRETILTAELSPAGHWLAMVVKSVGSESAAGARSVFTNSLLVMSIASGRTARLGSIGSTSSVFAWSPDGNMLTFDVLETEHHGLWLWNAADQSVRRVPNVQLDRGNLLWTADGRAVIASVTPISADPDAPQKFEGPLNQSESLFTTRQDARVQVYRSDPYDERKAQTIYDYSSNDRFRADLAKIDVSNGTITWIAKGMRPQGTRRSPDGQWIAFWTLTGQLGGNGYKNLFDLVIAPTDGQGPPRIVVHEVESISIVMAVSWSPNSSRLAYTSARQAKGSGLLEGIGECFLVGLNDSKPRPVQLAEPNDRQRFATSSSRGPLWSTSGDALFLTSAGGLWRVDTSDGQAHLVAGLEGKDMLQIIAPQRQDWIGAWAPSNSLLIIARDRQNGNESISRIDLSSGRSRLLLEAPASFSSTTAKFDVASDGRQFIYPRETADLTEQLWLSDPQLRSPRQLTHLNSKLDSFELGRSRLISWQSLDGTPIQGALFLPVGYRTGKRYPLVVEVSGDDKLSGSVNLFGGWGGFTTPLHNAQFLMSHGFAVLAADTHTRSDSKARDLAASILPGVDRAIELGIADPDRLGIKGQSAGGYAALALIVQTGRFKAAVVSAGFADLPGVYGQMHSDGTHWMMSWLEDSDNMAATLWEHPARYIDNSPYFYLDRVTTPLLLIHGNQDTAVDARFADQIFVALRRLDRRVEYAKYVDEGHLILGRANAIDAADRMLHWFDEYLKGHSARPKTGPMLQ